MKPGLPVFHYVVERQSRSPEISGFDHGDASARSRVSVTAQRGNRLLGIHFSGGGANADLS